MKEEKCRQIYKAITEIDEGIIEEALDFQPAAEETADRYARREFIIRRIVPKAAAIVLAAAAVIVVIGIVRGGRGGNGAAPGPGGNVVQGSTGAAEEPDTDGSNDISGTEPGTKEADTKTDPNSQETAAGTGQETQEAQTLPEGEPGTAENETAPDGLRMLEIPERILSTGGAGTPQLPAGMSTDGSDIPSEEMYYIPACPSWEDIEDSLSTLPVFRNGSYDSSGAGVPLGLSEEEMTQRIYDAAAALDLQIQEIYAVSSDIYLKEDAVSGKYANVVPLDPDSTDNSPGYDYDAAIQAGYVKCRVTDKVHAVTSHGELEAYANGSVRWILSIPIGDHPDTKDYLPEELQFSVPFGTDDEALRAAEYYIEKYGAFLGFEDPQPVIETVRVIRPGENASAGKDAGTSGAASSVDTFRTFYVYDASGDPVADNLNYRFAGAALNLGDDGSLWMISRQDSLLLAESYGDYPVITRAEAETALHAGRYIRSDYSEIDKPREDCEIAEIKLIYTGSPSDQLFMPCYRFLLRCEDTDEDGNRSSLYGTFFVPAVSSEYLKMR